MYLSISISISIYIHDVCLGGKYLEGSSPVTQNACTAHGYKVIKITFERKYQNYTAFNSHLIVAIHFRMLWNYCIIFLSVVINVIMLVTWEAKASLKNVRPNATSLPAAIDEYGYSLFLL